MQSQTAFYYIGQVLTVDLWFSAHEACLELSTSCQSYCHINNCLSLVSVIALYLK